MRHRTRFSSQSLRSPQCLCQAYLRRFAYISILSVLGVSPRLHAQSFQGGNADISVGGTGQFTSALPYSQASAGQSSSSRAAGALLEVQEHPLTWAGLELSYRYSRFTESYQGTISNANALKVPLTGQEGTAAYLIHSHLRGFQPFVAVGGGALYLQQNGEVNGQLRTAALLAAGLDLPTLNPHIGLRLQGRSLYYRAPTIGSNQLHSSSFEVSVEPAASIYLRF